MNTVGIKIPLSFFNTQFCVTVEEKFHMEDRYCQMTGKKLKPVKVVDVPGGANYKYPNNVNVSKEDLKYVFQGECDFVQDVLERIGKGDLCNDDFSTEFMFIYSYIQDELPEQEDADGPGIMMFSPKDFERLAKKFFKNHVAKINSTFGLSLTEADVFFFNE